MSRNPAGFTLLELLATIAVAAVLLGVGAPALSALADHTRTTGTMHLLTGSLSTARLEAVRRNRPIAVCPSRDGLTCTGGTNWDQGWIVFADPARLGTPSGPDAVLQVFDAPGGRVSLRATAGRRLVRFAPSGWSAGSNVSLRLCAGDGPSARLVAKVVVNNGGRVRSERILRPTPCPYTT